MTYFEKPIYFYQYHIQTVSLLQEFEQKTLSTNVCMKAIHYMHPKIADS